MASSPQLMSSLVLLPAVSLFVFLLYRFIVYPALLSPLSKIPAAHPLASISPAWILLVRFQRRENRVLHAAHKRLGPFVRIGPNEVSINDLGGVRTVYQGGFEKTSWYSVFDNYGVPCMFSTNPSKEHSLRKRMISNVYSKSHIQSSEASQAQAKVVLYDRLLPILEEATAEGQKPHGIDVHSLFLAATMDFISAYIFGIRHSTDFLKNAAYREHWLQLYSARANYPFFSQELPVLTRIMKRLRIQPYPSWVDAANEELGEWNRRLCAATMADDAAIGPISASSNPAEEAVVMKAVLAGLQREKEEQGKDSILYSTAILHHDVSVASELFDHVLAGQETAGITLTYLVWRLSKDLDLQRKLHAELMTLDPNMKQSRGAAPETTIGEQQQQQQRESVVANPKQLDSLELLHAVLMETLRLYAAIPGPQPRQALYPSCRIGPYEVPGGTRVSALAHTLHRDERVFPRSEEWDHTRWLAADEEARKEMNRQFWAFGSGGRMCIGSNFAVNEIKLIVASIYSNYTTHIVDDVGMEQGDGYTVGPESGRLYVRFEHIA